MFRTFVCALGGALLLVGLLVPAALSADKTLVGTIYGGYEFVTDEGEVIDLAPTDLAEELAELDGLRVMLKGDMREEGGMLSFVATSYTLMPEEGERGEENPWTKDEQTEEIDSQTPAQP